VYQTLFLVMVLKCSDLQVGGEIPTNAAVVGNHSFYKSLYIIAIEV